MNEMIQEIQSLLDKQSLCAGSVIKSSGCRREQSNCKAAWRLQRMSVRAADRKGIDKDSDYKEYPSVEDVILDTSVSDDLLSFC